MTEVISIVNGVLAVIGGATVLLRAVAPFTENKRDDHVLKFLERILAIVSLDSKSGEDGVLKIRLKR